MITAKIKGKPHVKQSDGHKYKNTYRDLSRPVFWQWPVAKALAENNRTGQLESKPFPAIASDF